MPRSYETLHKPKLYTEAAHEVAVGRAILERQPTPSPGAAAANGGATSAAGMPTNWLLLWLLQMG
jgi:hypothetical protein